MTHEQINGAVWFFVSEFMLGEIEANLIPFGAMGMQFSISKLSISIKETCEWIRTVHLPLRLMQCEPEKLQQTSARTRRKINGNSSWRRCKMSSTIIVIENTSFTKPHFAWTHMRCYKPFAGIWILPYNRIIRRNWLWGRIGIRAAAIRTFVFEEIAQRTEWTRSKCGEERGGIVFWRSIEFAAESRRKPIDITGFHTGAIFEFGHWRGDVSV